MANAVSNASVNNLLFMIVPNDEVSEIICVSREHIILSEAVIKYVTLRCNEYSGFILINTVYWNSVKCKIILFLPVSTGMHYKGHFNS
jgi:hypothetical protein